MGHSPISVKKEILEKLSISSPSEFNAVLRQAGTTQRRGIADGPRKFYPTFEHLIIFLYARYFSKEVPRMDIFGPLSAAQKISLGEAIDLLIFSNFLPAHAPITPRLSLLQLCYDDRFGFRDDPVLLQKMWYVRAHVLLLDVPDASGGGGKWKWYDHHLTLVIYSWVRHNRKYHGCPKESCHCRHMIDLYGLSIHRFKGLYMALEKQCVTQLHFIRGNEPLWTPAEGSKSLSRAVDAMLYEKPNRNIWPSCLADNAADPDPPEPPSPPSNTMASQHNPAPPSEPSLTQDPPPVPAQPPPPTTPAPKLPGLPPPHPSLPARPKTFDVQQTFPPQQHAWHMQFRPTPMPANPITIPPTLQPFFGEHSIVEPQQAQLPASGSGSMQGPAYPYGTPAGNPLTQAAPPPTSSTFQLKVGPPSRQTVIDMPPVKIGPPVRTKMFPPPNAPTGPAAMTRTSISPSKETGDRMAPATPSSATSTPSMDPASPVQSTHSQATTEGSKSQTPAPTAADKAIPPSAPRSMRAAAANAKAAGAIPTGPRALMGATKTTTIGSMAGVPSGPRALRGLTGASVKPLNSTNSHENLSTPTGLKDAGTVPKGVKEESGNGEAQSTSAKTERVVDLISTSNPTPINPQPITGKRTRSEMKEDEGKASSELRDKQVERKEDESRKTDPEKQTTRQLTPPRSVAPTSEPSSLPPAKRLRQLVEPESPSSSKGRTPPSKASTKSTTPAQAAVKSDADTVNAIETATPSRPMANTKPVEVIEAEENVSPTKKTFTSKAIKTKSKAKLASPKPSSKTGTPAPQTEPNEKASDKRKPTKAADTASEAEKTEPKSRSTKAKPPAIKSKSKATKESTADVEANAEKEMSAAITKNKNNPKQSVTDVMEVDPSSQPEVLPSIVKSEETKVNPSSQPTNPASLEIVSSLRSGPPFPSVIMHATDPKSRMQSRTHEARRLICLMIWLGIPLDWESIYVTENGIAVRENAMPMVVASLTEEKVTQLMSAGISLTVTPPDPLSDGDTDDAENPPETRSSRSSELKLSVSEGDGLIRLFDGKEERRLRHPEEEGKRLMQMITALFQWKTMEEQEYKMESMTVGSTSLTAMVFSKETSLKIDVKKTAVLGQAGIAVYQGTTQIAGPISLFIKDITSPTFGEATHDWKSMRAEVAKMRLPWESPSARGSFSSPATSTTFHTRGSSFDSLDSQLNQSLNSFTSDASASSPYSRLLRPALWSSSTTIMTRMAVAGIRWEGLGAEVEWSDVSDDEDEDMEVRVEATRIAA